MFVYLCKLLTFRSLFVCLFVCLFCCFLLFFVGCHVPFVVDVAVCAGVFRVFSEPVRFYTTIDIGGKLKSGDCTHVPGQMQPLPKQTCSIEIPSHTHVTCPLHYYLYFYSVFSPRVSFIVIPCLWLLFSVLRRTSASV